MQPLRDAECREHYACLALLHDRMIVVSRHASRFCPLVSSNHALGVRELTVLIFRSTVHSHCPEPTRGGASGQLIPSVFFHYFPSSCSCTVSSYLTPLMKYGFPLLAHLPLVRDRGGYSHSGTVLTLPLTLDNIFAISLILFLAGVGKSANNIHSYLRV